MQTQWQALRKSVDFVASLYGLGFQQKFLFGKLLASLARLDSGVQTEANLSGGKRTAKLCNIKGKE
jgi:hypothetical protein